eukprot:CAMPEP_0204381808 /NCGR_PEP_ID=MMETSP0469-20131031/54563_1 /ASSEMBLY_ACC=CAM_ASM_000384 /TAXON_ID=2969 /ORGANISM="Oxyrrhis marina" /LENGTH=50 /DNA_ID=CAMNT_0051373729 /DNA_START=9 /DNA_END=158 /DNA_ORIENTATION=+
MCGSPPSREECANRMAPCCADGAGDCSGEAALNTLIVTWSTVRGRPSDLT